LQKSTLAFKWGKTKKTINFGGKSCLSIAATYIFTALTYTITIITLRDLIKISFFFADTTERWDRGVKGSPKIG
jgi:hypothetical protein